MNVLNGNLIQLPVINVYVISTSKRKATFTMASTLFYFVSKLQYVCLFYDQTPGVSLQKENINILINVKYLYMLHVCIYKHIKGTI